MRPYQNDKTSLLNLNLNYEKLHPIELQTACHNFIFGKIFQNFYYFLKKYVFTI